MGKATDPEWSFGDVDAGFKNAALVLDETFVTPNTSHQPLETRTAMAYWQNGKVYVHSGTQSTAQTVPGDRALAWLLMTRSTDNKVVVISEYTGGGFGSKITSAISADHSRAAFKEGRRAGDDAHQPRRRALHRPRASQPARPPESRIRQGRQESPRVDMFVVMRQRPVRSAGRCQPVGPHGVADVPAAGHALARRSRC